MRGAETVRERGVLNSPGPWWQGTVLTGMTRGRELWLRFECSRLASVAPGSAGETTSF